MEYQMDMVTRLVLVVSPTLDISKMVWKMDWVNQLTKME